MKDFNFILFNINDKLVKHDLVKSLLDLDIMWITGFKENIRIMDDCYICFCVDNYKKSLVKHRLYVNYDGITKKDYEIYSNMHISYLSIPLKEFDLFKENFVDGVFNLERFRTMIKPKVIANNLGIF